MEVLDEAGMLEVPAYYACDVCQSFHPEDSAGDCDDAGQCFNEAELDELHPEGWVEL
jgi:hypothetical protein